MAKEKFVEDIKELLNTDMDLAFLLGLKKYDKDFFRLGIWKILTKFSQGVNVNESKSYPAARSAEHLAIRH
jgi:hypothetical protein